MGELIEHGDSDAGPVVQVGESQSRVSLKVYQDIYHQVTGRTEQIRKRYTENLLLDLSEIEQLHHKVMQLCDIHTVVAHNETISVFHEKERKEQFTSFERFLAYNANTASPSVVVSLKYNFSIIPAGREFPQEYVIAIRLTSRVAMMKQMDDDTSSFIRGGFFGVLTGNTAEITIDYADYVIARGYLEAFDEWVSGCKSTPKSRLLHFLRRHSHRISDVTQLIVAVLIVLFGLRAIPEFFNDQTSSAVVARFFIIYSGGAYILIRLTHLMAEVIEQAIDTFTELSYLKLNKGDVKIINEASSVKKRVVIRFILGCFGTILLGILSAKLEKIV